MKTRTAIATACILTLLAGVSVGVWGGRTLPPRREQRSSLADQLDLTSQQREQMDAIWSGMLKDEGKQRSERWHELQKQRDESIVALLADEQKRQYEQITADFAKRNDELAKEREKAFELAVEKTREILSESQRQKYEEILKKRRERGDGPGKGGPRRRGDHPASSRGAQ